MSLRGVTPSSRNGLLLNWRLSGLTASGVIGWYMGESVDVSVGCVRIKEHWAMKFVLGEGGVR